MKGNYRGEVNEKGEAHGNGMYVGTDGDTYTGTFFHNKADGFCK